MIDIIQQLQAANPGLGSTIIVLRQDSRALMAADQLTPEVAEWIDRHAPGAKLSRERIVLAPYPGGEPSPRDVTVLAFCDSRHLAAFATKWTGDPLPEESEDPNAD